MGITSTESNTNTVDHIEVPPIMENKSLVKKHIISVFFSLFLLIVLVGFIFYIIINSDSPSSAFLLNHLQATSLFGNGTYSSYVSDAHSLNAPNGSFISTLIGNQTVYVAQFYGSSQFFQEFIVNRTNPKPLISKIYSEIFSEAHTFSIKNGTYYNINYFYTLNSQNNTAHVLTLIGESENTIIIFSADYTKNLSINTLSSYLFSNLTSNHI